MKKRSTRVENDGRVLGDLLGVPGYTEHNFEFPSTLNLFEIRGTQNAFGKLQDCEELQLSERLSSHVPHF